jgi:hypothetical protein
MASARGAPPAFWGHHEYKVFRILDKSENIPPPLPRGRISDGIEDMKSGRRKGGGIRKKREERGKT